jgi:hypothetical protein
VHNAFVGTGTVALVLCTGDPDEVRSIKVIDKPAA